jgi:hypothetical protein
VHVVRFDFFSFYAVHGKLIDATKRNPPQGSLRRASRTRGTRRMPFGGVPAR